jgi:hypothetical protein
MLTVTDLSTETRLEREELRAVRGGRYLAEAPIGAEGVFAITPVSYAAVVNAPRIDVGVHTLNQGQSVALDQRGSLGGFNVSESYQRQIGFSGQVA